MKVKISKKMSSLIMPSPGRQDVNPPIAASAGLPGCETIQDLIRSQLSAGSLAKDGSVQITLMDSEVRVLTEHGKLAQMRLELLLNACTTDEEKRPYFGENSAWGALLRSIVKQAA